MRSKFPPKKSDNELSRSKNLLGNKFENILTWINSEDGQLLSNMIKSLGSFVIGDPTGIIIPYVFDLSNSNLRRRFLKDFNDLTNRLNENKEKIDGSFLKSEIGQEILKETIHQLINQNDEEKRKSHIQFLVNAYTKEKARTDRISVFMNILILLEPSALQILHVISNPEETVTKIMEKHDHTRLTNQINLKNDVRRLLTIDSEIFERAITKLESEQIIARNGLEIAWCSGEYHKEQKNEAKIRMTEALKRLVTQFGKDFTSYFTNTK
ncbi:MAG: hypothetical protein ABI342_07220 [Nitrososphaera sp.]